MSRETLSGMFGCMLAISSPWLDFLNVTIQITGGLGGLVLLFFSVRYKWLQIQELKKAKK